MFSRAVVKATNTGKSDGNENWQMKSVINPSLAEHDMPVWANSVEKPTDLDLLCLPLNMWISIKNPDQVIWLAGN